MSKGLKTFRIMVKDNDLELLYHNTIQVIEKELKALEIIKKHYKIGLIGTDLKNNKCSVQLIETSDMSIEDKYMLVEVVL